MSLYFAASIEGLRNPLSTTDPNPVLFVHGDITALTLPAALAGATVLPWLENADPGEGWSSDLRKPISGGGEQALHLLDTPDGALGRLLLFDPAETTWDIEPAIIAVGVVVIRVSGPIEPPTGFYWIEEECVRVTGVARVHMGGADSALSYDLTITRGQCGSRDVVHMLSTASFAPGDDGREERLTLWQRPNFGAFRFRGTMYLLNAAFSANPAEVVEARHFFVDEEPLAGIPSYQVKLRDVAEVIEHHTFQIGIDTRLLFRLLVLSEGTETTTTAASGGTITTIRKLPNQCRLYLDRLRAASLFGEPLSQPSQPGFDAALVTDFNTRLDKTPDVHYYIKLLTRDSEWLFEVTSVTHASDFDFGSLVIPLVQVALTLRDYPKGQSIDQEPDAGEQVTGDQTIIDTYPNTAFTRNLVLFGGRPGILLGPEDPPTLQLWYGLTCNPVDAYLYLTSSNGAFSADPYDAIIGRGLGIPADWQSRGVAPAAPLLARWDTLDLLELRALLSEEYTYYLKSGDKLGDFLINLCTLHTLLHGPRNDASLTLTRWARPREGETIPSFDADISYLVSPGERLTPLRAFLLYSGIKLLTLEPEFVRSVTLGGSAYRESGAPLAVRVWQPGNQLTDERLQQGAIGHLLRAFFSTMGGAPIRLSIASSVMAQNLEIGRFVLVTNDRVPTPQGRGLVNIRHIIVGGDTNYRTGEKTYRVLRDYYGELPGGVGNIAPTLTLPLSPIVDPGGLTFEIPLTSFGDVAFNPATDHSFVWQQIADDIGFVHLMNPAFHNPTDQNDVEGWGEMYGQIVGVISDAGTGLGRLVVAVDPAWARAGITPTDLCQPGAIVSLVDSRPPASNPQGALIQPIAAQLAPDLDILAFSSRVSFQRSFSVIG